MPIRNDLKDSENYQLIAGLDEIDDAQELRFDDDKVKVSIGDSAVVSAIQDLMLGLKAYSGEIITELKILNTHLSILTDNTIGEEDAH